MSIVGRILFAIWIFIMGVCMVHDTYRAFLRVPYEEISIGHSNWTLGSLMLGGAGLTIITGVKLLLSAVESIWRNRK